MSNYLRLLTDLLLHPFGFQSGQKALVVLLLPPPSRCDTLELLLSAMGHIRMIVEDSALGNEVGDMDGIYTGMRTHPRRLGSHCMPCAGGDVASRVCSTIP